MMMIYHTWASAPGLYLAWTFSCTTGQYLYEEVEKLPDYEVAFVWNRTDDKMKGVVPDHLILQDLSNFSSRYYGIHCVCVCV